MDKPKIRFNIVDALVLLAVLLVAAGVCYQLFFQQVSQTVAPTVKLKVVAVSYSNRMHHVEAAQNEKLPSQMVAGNSVVSGAYLTGVYYEPSELPGYTANGGIVGGIDPTRYDIYFEMEATAPRDNAVYKIGAQEVRVGKTFVIKTNLLEFNGFITEIEVIEAS